MGALEPTSSLPPELPPTGRPFNPVEAAIGVITRPVPAMQAIAAARPWLMALLLSVIIGLLSGLAGMTAPAPSPADMGDLAQLPPEQQRAIEGILGMVRSPALGIGNAIINPIVLAIWAGILWLVARLLGGIGQYSSLFSTVGFASVPNILLAPITALLNLGGAALAALSSLVGFAFAIWTIVLTVIAIRESMRLSTGRSVATCAIPAGSCLLLICAIVVVFASLIIGAMSSGAAP